jgi:prevent-host-death family protein
MDNDEPTAVPASEARVHLGEMLRRVHRGEHIMIEKGGIPTAALIDVHDYEEYRRLKARGAGEPLPPGVLSRPAPDGIERLMRAAGGWKGIDIEKFKADIKASRRISTRPSVEL